MRCIKNPTCEVHVVCPGVEIHVKSNIEEELRGKIPEIIPEVKLLLEDNTTLDDIRSEVSSFSIKKPNSTISDKKLRKIREVYPRAYEPWSRYEDKLLIRAYTLTADTKVLSHVFQRNVGAIKSRTKKLSLGNDDRDLPLEGEEGPIPDAGGGNRVGSSVESFETLLICLANSRKYGKHCVAGKELSGGSIGGWIRPVTDTGTGELPSHAIKLNDGAIPQPLDIVKIRFRSQTPRGYQIENCLIDKNALWQKTGKISASALHRMCDRDSLWLNGESSRFGTNDRMRKEVVNDKVRSSLLFIKPEGLVFSVGVETGNQRKVRAQFTHNNAFYSLVVTDPMAEGLKEKPDGKYYPEGNVYLCISIGQPYQSYCYKLVAGVVNCRQLRPC